MRTVATLLKGHCGCWFVSPFYLASTALASSRLPRYILAHGTAFPKRLYATKAQRTYQDASGPPAPIVSSSSARRRNQVCRAAKVRWRREPKSWMLHDLRPGDWVDSRGSRKASELIYLKPSRKRNNGIFIGRTGRICIASYDSIVCVLPQRILPLTAVQIAGPLEEKTLFSYSLLEHAQTGFHDDLAQINEDDLTLDIQSTDIKLRREAVKALRQVDLSLTSTSRHLVRSGQVDRLYEKYAHDTDMVSVQLPDAIPEGSNPDYAVALHQLLLDDSRRFVADANSFRQTRLFHVRSRRDLEDLQLVEGWVWGGSPQLERFKGKVRDPSIHSDPETKVFERVLLASLSDHSPFQSEVYVAVVGTLLKQLDVGDWHIGQYTSKVVEVLQRLGRLEKDQNLVLLDPFSPVASWDRPPVTASEAAALDVADHLAPHRVDFGDQVIYVVDGPDAHELDDGVSCELLNDGECWVHVHVADPCVLLQWDHPYVQAARARIQSIYLDRQRWSMLPPAVSSDDADYGINLGSTSPQRTLVFSARFSKDHKLVEKHVRAALVNKVVRTTYQHVNAVLKNEPCPSFRIERPIDQMEHGSAQSIFERLQKIALALHRQRVDDGMMMVKRPLISWPGSSKQSNEYPIVDFESEDEITGPSEPEPMTAERMIAELMIMANRLAAGYFTRSGAPCLYRTIERPAAGSEAAEALEWLEQDRDSRTGEVPWMDALMHEALQEPARYSIAPREHIGIGIVTKDHGGYLQVTSPLRRFPDLLAHFQLHTLLRGQSPMLNADEVQEICDEINASMRSRRRFQNRAQAHLDLLRITDYIGVDKPTRQAIIVSEGRWSSADSCVVAIGRVPELGGVNTHIRAHGRDLNIASMIERLQLGAGVEIRLINVVLDMQPTLYADLV